MKLAVKFTAVGQLRVASRCHSPAGLKLSNAKQATQICCAVRQCYFRISSTLQLGSLGALIPQSTTVQPQATGF